MSTAFAAEPFRGWRDTYRLENDAIATRVVADVGPRVVELAPIGRPSLLYLRDRELGGRAEPTWRFRGGWRLWVAPERRVTTYALDNAPCEVTRPAADTLIVAGPPQPAASIRKTVTLRVDAGRPRVVVESRIRNVGAASVTYALWTLAALRPGGRAFVPLDVGAPEAFDAVRRVILWSYADVADPRYRIGNRLVEVDHGVVTRQPAPVTIAPHRTSDESKIGVDSRRGWGAYHLGSTLLVTRARVDAGAQPDGGATLEVYSSREFLELEHLGVLETIAPDAEATLCEDWWLFDPVVLPPASEGLGAVEDALAPYVRTVESVPL